MTDWHPPLSDGLADGDRYLSEDIETAGTTPTAAHQPGAYVLVCSHPRDESLADLRDRWRDATGHEHTPEYLADVAQAERVFYVGGAGDVYDRIDEHLTRAARRVSFLKVFPPHHVHTVWFDSDPFEREEKVAGTLQRQRPESYVHQR
jgi:hypothetical protein